MTLEILGMDKVDREYVCKLDLMKLISFIHAKKVVGMSA